MIADYVPSIGLLYQLFLYDTQMILFFSAATKHYEPPYPPSSLTPFLTFFFVCPIWVELPYRTTPMLACANVFDDGLLDSHTFDEHIQKRADPTDIHQATALSISDGR